MQQLHFDAKHLEEILSQMPPKHRIAFCASVCERLLPNYSAFAQQESWGDPGVLRVATEEIWRVVRGEEVSRQRLLTFREECEGVIPDTEAHQSVFTSAALDAANAVYESLLCCIDGDPHRCVEIASYARDSVHMYVQVRDALQADDPRLEDKILRDPLMMRELTKQADDLRLLSNTERLTVEAIKQLRADNRSSLGLD